MLICRMDICERQLVVSLQCPYLNLSIGKLYFPSPMHCRGDVISNADMLISMVHFVRPCFALGCVNTGDKIAECLSMKLVTCLF